MTENRLIAREVDEFMGIARVLSRQAALSENDVRYLDDWFDVNQRVVDYPLFAPIINLIVPGLLDVARRAPLHRELAALVGDVNGDGFSDGPAASIYDNPGQIVFLRKLFCFTGDFNYGKRWECEKAVVERDGGCGALVRITDYLVVGSKSPDAWKHSTFGNEISRAKSWQLAGQSIVQIVKESDWVKSLHGPSYGIGGGTPPGPFSPPGPGSTQLNYRREEPKPFGQRTSFG